MIKKCPICMKAFSVPYPSEWRFVRDGVHMCSWTCLRLHDKGKEDTNMNRLTLDMKKKAVQIALDNGDHLDYLRACGMKNPSASWSYILTGLKKAEPDTWKQLMNRPKMKSGPKPAEKIPVVNVDGPLRIETPEAKKIEVVETSEDTIANAMAGMEGAIDDFFGKCKAMGIKTICDDGVETKMPELPKITSPVAYDGLTIREVEGGFGRWRRTDVGESIYIDFEPADGVDTISLTVEQWRGLRKEREKAFAVLGVDA